MRGRRRRAHRRPSRPGSQAAAGGPKPVEGTVQTLLAPDLAVQALLAGSSIGETGTGEAALRLRGAGAYGGAGA